MGCERNYGDCPLDHEAYTFAPSPRIAATRNSSVGQLGAISSGNAVGSRARPGWEEFEPHLDRAFSFERRAQQFIGADNDPLSAPVRNHDVKWLGLLAPCL